MSLLFFCALEVIGQDQSEVRVTIQTKGKYAHEALQLLGSQPGVKLSYSPEIVPKDKVVSSDLVNTPLEKALEQILGHDFTFKYRGSYIIIQKKPKPIQKKTKIQFSGEIKDASTGEKIPDATVYEVNNLNAVLSDSKGSFELSVAAKEEYVSFVVSREHYKDTVIHVAKNAQAVQTLELVPVAIPEEPKNKWYEFETDKIVQLFTTVEFRKNLKNVKLFEEKVAQFSVVPKIGTNGKLSGQIDNDFSFNLLAGYANGLTGAEIGGLYNIERGDVKGFQLAGVGNTVGGGTQGIQISGVINTNREKSSGFLIAGVLNVVTDSVAGAQISGVVNTAKDVEGAQITGAVNTSTARVSGLQISGGLNTAKRVSGMQISGALNTARRMYGLQASGGINRAKRVWGVQIGSINVTDTLSASVEIGALNFTKNPSSGLQISGVANVAKQFKGVQMSAAVNVADEVKGVQVSSFMNVAKKVKGLQIGVVNIADSASAVLGLVNIVQNGMFEFGVEHNDVLEANVKFRMGTPLLYTVITSGIRLNDTQAVGVGLGLGSQWTLVKRLYGNLEVTGQQIYTSRKDAHRLNALYQANLNLGFRADKHLKIQAGPVFYLYLQRPDYEWGYVNQFNSNILFRRMNSARRFIGWAGYSVALRF